MEDDPSLRSMYEMILKMSGFQIISTAKNGEEAVNFFKLLSIKPDIILMDHRMPIKNGLDATKEILQIDHHSKIIFLSADLSIKDEALAIGAIDFKKKPFTIDMLIESIKKALE